MGCFNFVQELDMDVYNRYLLIEDSIKSHNSNVYLNMQLYLEHLFKFVSKRQGYNVHTNKKLGELLTDYRIENFCHVKLEYDRIAKLKAVNHYGNKYKHNRILDFNFTQLMEMLQEIYFVSKKIYYHYKKNRIQTVPDLSECYYRELLESNEHTSERVIALENQNTLLLTELEIKERIIESLKAHVKEVRQESYELKSDQKKYVKTISKLEKQQDTLNSQLEKYNSELLNLKAKNVALTAMVRSHFNYDLFEARVVNELIDKTRLIKMKDMIG